MRTAIILVAILCISSVGFSATLIVPTQYGTIQAAINAASKGDTVLVKPGTYEENIYFKQKAITVKSVDGPEATVIDGGTPSNPLLGSGVNFVQGEGLDSVLEGFTILNGTGTYDATYGFIGGGIYCEGSSPTITKNIIRDNQADYGGGIEAYQGSSPMISENTISTNLALGGSPEGGAGAGICMGFDSSPIIVNNQILDNVCNPVSNCGAAGIFFGLNCAPLIEGNTISDNRALFGNVGGIGALHDCSGTISNNIICHNSAEGNSGGIGIGDNCSVTITGNLIYKNIAKTYGGGIAVGIDCSVVITNNVIYENTADIYGGAISCWTNSSLMITENIIHKNTAKEGGGGIELFNDIEMILTNNTIYGNSASSHGGGVRCEGASITITNTILWNNEAPIGPEVWAGQGFASHDATLFIGHSVLEGGWSSVCIEEGAKYCVNPPGLIHADPQFVDGAMGDFHILYTSPCRDAGSASAPGFSDKDFEGDPRAAFGLPDIGADEFYTHLYYTGEATPGGDVKIKLVGLPGSAPVKLLYSLGVFDPPLPSNWGDWYLTFPFWSISLAPIKASGVEVFTVPLPPSPPGPYSIPMQAFIGGQLSNLCVMEVE